MIRIILLSLLLLFGALSTPSRATTALDYQAFSQIPVLHEGRVKPLDTFARIHLQRFYGQDYLPKKPAIAWLAELLLSPEVAAAQPVFHVYSPAVITTLGLPQKNDKLYSYEELAAPLDAKKELLNSLAIKDQNSFSASEKALWSLYENVSDFSQISRAFSLFLPLSIEPSDTLLKQLKLPEIEPPFTYLKLVIGNKILIKELQKIIKKKGEDPARYNPQEQELALLSFALTALEIAGNSNQLVRVFPSPWNHNQDWHSAWQLVRQGKGSPQASLLMKKWERLAAAHRDQNAPDWQKLTQEIMAETQSISATSSHLIHLELLYNRINFVPKIIALYGLAILLVLWSWFQHHPRINSVSRHILWLALSLHGLLIMIRMILLNRPPVSTLYESILFVAFIAAAYGLWLSYRKAQSEGLLISSLLGGGLLAASNAYAGQGDSMGMLIAVLNTNFWLATHVVCITIGYGCALIAGTLAHLCLLPNYDSAHLKKLLPFTTVVALLFTAIGTILGGIWADQSWGRFWGWDPKENGALWIVLWLTWLLHGRLSGAMQDAGFAALLALSNIIVALSWFGVNLLNTGLHSYGFTDAAAYGLALFCGVELLIISLLYFWKKRQNHLRD